MTAGTRNHPAAGATIFVLFPGGIREIDPSQGSERHQPREAVRELCFLRFARGFSREKRTGELSYLFDEPHICAGEPSLGILGLVDLLDAALERADSVIAHLSRELFLAVASRSTGRATMRTRILR